MAPFSALSDLVQNTRERGLTTTHVDHQLRVTTEKENAIEAEIAIAIEIEIEIATGKGKGIEIVIVTETETETREGNFPLSTANVDSVPLCDEFSSDPCALSVVNRFHHGPPLGGYGGHYGPSSASVGYGAPPQGMYPQPDMYSRERYPGPGPAVAGNVGGFPDWRPGKDREYNRRPPPNPS